jgi:hypothetical protein
MSFIENTASNDTTLVGSKMGLNFSDGDKSVTASPFTIAYTRSIFKGLAVEGSLGGFFVRTPVLGSDGYGAAQKDNQQRAAKLSS